MGQEDWTAKAMELFRDDAAAIRKDCVDGGKDAREAFIDAMGDYVLNVVDEDLRRNGIESRMIGLAYHIHKIDYGRIFDEAEDARRPSPAGPR